MLYFCLEIYCDQCVGDIIQAVPVTPKERIGGNGL